MAIPYDCHTHTTVSDGRNSIEENVRQAEAMGLADVLLNGVGPVRHRGVGVAVRGDGHGSVSM